MTRSSLVGDYFREPVKLAPSRRVCLLPAMPGFRLEYVIGSNEAPDVDGVSFRELEFNVFKGGRHVAAHGRCIVLNASPDTDPFELLDCAADVSDEHHEIADVIVGSCSKAIALFEAGAVLALEYIELSCSLRGQGLGALLGKALLHVLTARYRCSLVIWKPFPLQYLDSDLAAHSRGEKREFKAACRRLRNHYRSAWGAQALGASGWLGWAPPRGQRVIETDDVSWRLVEPG